MPLITIFSPVRKKFLEREKTGKERETNYVHCMAFSWAVDDLLIMDWVILCAHIPCYGIFDDESENNLCQIIKSES